MEKVQQSSGCWLWCGHKAPLGYGGFYAKGKRQLAHRVSYELFVGPIPADKELDHICKTPACVNPAHLEPVTHQINMQRAERGAPVDRRNKTHCPQGHPYSGSNLVVWNNQRFCRACQSKYKSEYKERGRLEKNRG